VSRFIEGGAKWFILIFFNNITFPYLALIRHGSFPFHVDYVFPLSSKRLLQLLTLWVIRWVSY